MNKYTKQAKCPKCGSKDIGDRFVRHGGYHGSLSEGYCYTDQEHIHRYCRNCSYNWAELPLDYAEPQP